ncbi:MAG: LD-carboxypeptidase [Tenuifilaceae bacterium]|jgi:muramoyltetrapeptide carboxypeptidase|nr:LD-carboxypeptidase [Tenuifilaceae bacterium]
MELISPPILKKGDTVGIVAPARRVIREEIEPAIKIFESWGLKVKLGANIFGAYNQFSGTDIERAADFQSMIDDAEVKAIICARGGYGTIRLLDHINLRYLQRDPKWVVGYSDITVLHSILNSWFKMETIHGPMPINFPQNGTDNSSTRSLQRVLFGECPSYNIAPHESNRSGMAEGELCGGNLSILYSIAGTDADINTSNKVLFIEDLDEYLYHVDRMMMNLKRSGKLSQLAGLVIGGMTSMKDNTIPYGQGAIEIISNAVAEYDYPVCFGFPAGHLDENLALMLGRNVTLKVANDGVQLSFSAPACEL